MTDAGGSGWRTLRAVVLALLAVKLVLLVAAHPFMDETYYFIWGRHPALSYFDHPPLIGWTQGIAGLLFGSSILGLRAMVLLSFAGDVALLLLFARELGGENWRRWFWTSTLLLLATPILFGLTSVALPDHLLILFTLLAAYAAERLRRAPGAVRWLYLAGFAIGAATLSKYTGALLGLAALLHLAATPALRPLWRSPHLHLAAALAVALQAPVLIWNVQHGFASFGFITGGRHALPAGFDLSGLRGYLLGAIAVLSPFLLWPLARFALGRDGHGFGRIVFWLSSLGFLVASFFTNILVHWNVVAYAAALPFLAPLLRSRLLLGAQVAYGVLAIAVAAVNYAVLPITALTSGRVDQTSGWSYGWNEVAAAVREIEKTGTAGFVAATDYALAAPLGFALADTDVTSLAPGRDAYDDWFDAAAHRGQDAIIVADRWRPLQSAVAARFASVETVQSLPVVRFGHTLDTYTIYLARGFAGP